MTEQEIIKAAKTNWLAWQGLKELQPEVALWMEGHKKDLGYMNQIGKIDGIGMLHNIGTSAWTIYRLRPDYEPHRYWFQPSSGTVYQGAGFGDDSGWLEVTAEYAEYLRRKPDGEWELRIVKAGDIYWSSALGVNVANADFDLINTIHDRCYRWCKPKQPEAGWREYRVEARNGVHYVKGYKGGDMALHKALCRVGFGGVQFDGQKERHWWYMNISMLITESGYIGECDDGVENKPAVPVKARFWESK